MAAAYTALSRWKPRIRLSFLNIPRAFDGSMMVELTSQHATAAVSGVAALAQLALSVKQPRG